MQGASVLVLTQAPYSYGELNYCDRLHILITFIYIITPLPTSTHKPVLARAPSSTSEKPSRENLELSEVKPLPHHFNFKKMTYGQSQ